MPDPITTITGEAARKAVESTAPLLHQLLSPTAKFLGDELLFLVKRGLSERRAEKGVRNLSMHLQKVKETIAEKYNPPHVSIKNILGNSDIAAEWLEGAQNVDPEDEELSRMWQGILVDIASGNYVQKSYLQVLKTLTPDEARLLLFFSEQQVSKKSLPAEEKIIMLQLTEKNLPNQIFRHYARG